MKITNIEIKNFRAIENSSFNFKDYSVLLGINNSGKSTVLDAIRIFYDEENFNKGDIPASSKDTEETSITIKFDNDEKITKKFPKDKEKGIYIKGETKNDKIKKDIKNGIYGKLIYIPPNNDIDNHLKLTGPSDFRDIIKKLIMPILQNNEDFQKLKKEFPECINAAKTDNSHDSLMQFERKVNDELKSWNTEIKLNFEFPDIDNIIKSMIKINFAQYGNYNIDQLGSGFQRFL